MKTKMAKNVVDLSDAAKFKMAICQQIFDKTALAKSIESLFGMVS